MLLIKFFQQLQRRFAFRAFHSIQADFRTGPFVVIVQLHQVGIDDLEFAHGIRNVLLIGEGDVDIVFLIACSLIETTEGNSS